MSKKDKDHKLTNKKYEKEIEKLQLELVKLQQWVKNKNKKVVVIFEGRDAAGKGGVIRRITERLSPRICKVAALGIPTEKEKSQWYFQRYASHLPSGGEIVLFDRSWYNRAGVEKVMGYCTENEYESFLNTCPVFENMLLQSGIILIKYWFSVSDVEQEKRFEDRINDPLKRWKFSPMDLTAREKWVDYSKARDVMFQRTDTPISPWYVVNADEQKKARLNCISHLLSKIPYTYEKPESIQLPEIKKDKKYVRTSMDDQNFVPEIY